MTPSAALHLAPGYLLHQMPLLLLLLQELLLLLVLLLHHPPPTTPAPAQEGFEGTPRLPGELA
jgi:hypothetical protein